MLSSLLSAISTRIVVVDGVACTPDASLAGATFSTPHISGAISQNFRAALSCPSSVNACRHNLALMEGLQPLGRL